jgi:hypothetical protein
VNIQGVRLMSVVVACGCEAKPFEPEAVTTGIYATTVQTMVDTCEPPRSEGSAFVAAFQLGGNIGTFDYDNVASAVSLARYDLEAASNYEVRVPELGKRLDPCPSPSAESSYVRVYRLISATRDRFEVEKDETWTLAADCESLFPIASCHATSELSYGLLESCAPPCTIRADGPRDRYDGLRCACDAPPQ